MTPMRRRRSVRLAALTAGLAVLATGCGEKPLDTLAGDGPAAESINSLFFPVMIVAAVVFVLVEGAIVYLWWKNREKTDSRTMLYSDDDFPDQVHGNFRLEILWTIAPALLLSIIAVFTVINILELEEVDAADDDLRVTIVGQQWWWEMQYHLDGDTSTSPDFVTANELVIPVGVEVPLAVTARDVIHSWWIPRLNGKRDAVPGRSHPWKIEASFAGRFAGTCTEFCGLSHAYMRMWTVAMEPGDYQQWVTDQMNDGAVLQEGDVGYEGQQTFLANCSTCHVVVGVTSRDRNGDGTTEVDTWDLYDGANKYISESILVAGAAPNLTHFTTRRTYAGSTLDLYNDDGSVNRPVLEAWIRNPQDLKPAAADEQRGMPDLGLTEEQIDDVVDYLLTLG